MKFVYVDGYRIRQTLDTDFGLIHACSADPTEFSPKFYIPRGEWWIDHRVRDETDFLIAVAEAEYEPAEIAKHCRAPYVDQRRRYVIDRFARHGSPPDFIQRKEEREGCQVVFVNGAIVRQYRDPDFYHGGHDLVYSYVPANEIWLDVLMDPQDLPHVLLHEQTERRLMQEQRQSYDVAHEHATTAERQSRRRAGGMYPGDANYPPDWTVKLLLSTYVTAR